MSGRRKVAMKDFVGRISAVDPFASEDARIIDYFDRLVAARVGVDGLLREAAALSRSVIGYRNDRRSYRVEPPGSPDSAAPAADAVRIERNVGPAGLLWQEQGANSTRTAGMVLDRLALALAILERTSVGEDGLRYAIETLLAEPGPTEDATARERAWLRLRLDPAGHFRALAVPLTEAVPADWPSAPIDMPWGAVRAVVVRDGFAYTGRGGIGIATSPGTLNRSWRSALVAMRLSDSGPFNADALGLMLRAVDSAPLVEGAHPDLEGVGRALGRGWGLADLSSVARGASLRKIALDLGVHHSTVQARMNRLVETLGYDPQSALGAIRLSTALLVHRLSTWRPDDRPSTDDQ